MSNRPMTPSQLNVTAAVQSGIAVAALDFLGANLPAMQNRAVAQGFADDVTAAAARYLIAVGAGKPIADATDPNDVIAVVHSRVVKAAASDDPAEHASALLDIRATIEDASRRAAGQ